MAVRIVIPIYAECGPTDRIPVAVLLLLPPKPATLSKMPIGVRAAKRGLPPIPAFGIGWLYPVCPQGLPPGFAPRDTLEVREKPCGRNGLTRCSATSIFRSPVPFIRPDSRC